MPDATWTLDELAARVAEALDGYDGPASGRIQAVPDPRAIRYYTTLGLIDRPAAFQGRVAQYTARHLRQLVAIKRLQAEGLSLSEVQTRLAGASDRDLAAIAQLPDDRSSFWKAKPAAPAPAPAARAAVDAPSSSASDGASRAHAVRLPGGALLVLDAGRAPTDADLAAIAEAARPLTDLLTRRGLAGRPTRGKDHA